MNEHFSLDTCLFRMGDTPWTIRQAVEGVSIMGSVGSGKSSGSGRFIALKFLQAGFGGIVLCAKSDEADSWRRYCEQIGRIDDLIVVEPDGKYHFNFLDYEAQRKASILGATQNIAQVLKTVIRSGQDKATGKSDDVFWESALDMLIHNVVELCLIAYDTVSVERLSEIAASAPKKEGDAAKDKDSAFHLAIQTAKERINKELKVLSSTIPTRDLERMSKKEYETFILKHIPLAQRLKRVDDFFIGHYRTLSDKTRSIIDFYLSGFLFLLSNEPVRSLFCNEASNFTPEDSLDGKIILLNVPVKTFHKAGRDCQILFKYIWQRAMESRNIAENNRPVFLWADEAQHFLHEYDSEFQATARSSRIATVYISQNLPNYYANMGGEKSEHRVKSFLGTLGTKAFHSNADIETNRYASELIGEAYIEDVSVSQNIGENTNLGSAKSYKLERMVRPEDFVRLRNGSADNDHLVEALVHLQSRTFSSGWNHERITFRQQ
jgi:NAD(P)-dependent dehydrogenase (short-subunit alcohol dehydrogenase family)